MSELLKRTGNGTILEVDSTGGSSFSELPVISEIRFSGYSRPAIPMEFLEDQFDDFRPGTIDLGEFNFDMPEHLSESANDLIDTLKIQELPIPHWRRRHTGSYGAASGEDLIDDLWGFITNDEITVRRNERRVRNITVKLVPQPS